MADDDHPGFPKLDQKRVDAASRKVIKGIEASERTPERLDKSLARQLHRSMTLNTRLKNAVRDTIESIDVLLLREFPNIAKTLKDTLKKGDKDSDPEATFEVMLGAAHEAYEDEARLWEVQRSSVGWIVARMLSERDLMGAAAGTPMSPEDEVAYHRFDTYEEAQFFKRDKVLRAALEAALKVL